MKERIRKEMLGKLRDLPSRERLRMENELTKAVCSSREWKASKTIGVTWSNFPEIDTHKIIVKGLEEGKRMVVPYSGKDRVMTFHEYLPDTAMLRSKFGIMEPADKSNPVPPQEIDLLLVPGLAFSETGYRIGFGGGYYDRYLASYDGQTLSMLFPFQLFKDPDWEIEAFDVPVQKLLTAVF
ncbi:5-formyltetrahydrofolate cyclo-ligase [uncultured Trichococcus sp.]|uniref:5-formyltetrahydrofolate cyclo-ligase n=1 Tax=uncultured Trichococcus sp. TaxID=189665 RepID=UPI002A18BD43|nr:5-formyltetrahydrofolate cyclo-ligase [uncultured Trichococcus sp.]